jgi:hypothetical protein
MVNGLGQKGTEDLTFGGRGMGVSGDWGSASGVRGGKLTAYIYILFNKKSSRGKFLSSLLV